MHLLFRRVSNLSNLGNLVSNSLNKNTCMVLQKTYTSHISSKQFAVKFGQVIFSEGQVDFCSLLVRGQVENFRISTPLDKVRKTARIWNQYNEVPHLTQDTIWESDENLRRQQTQQSQKDSSFTKGYHKAARNREAIMAKTTIL